MAIPRQSLSYILFMKKLLMAFSLEGEIAYVINAYLSHDVYLMYVVEAFSSCQYVYNCSCVLISCMEGV